MLRNFTRSFGNVEKNNIIRKQIESHKEENNKRVKFIQKSFWINGLWKIKRERRAREAPWYEEEKEI